MGLGIDLQEWVVLGANLGRLIITSGEFAAYLCESRGLSQQSELRFGAVRGVDRRIAVLYHGIHVLQLEGEVLGVFVTHFRYPF